MPREIARIDRICALLKELWSKYPHMAFGELLYVCIFTKELSSNQDIWFVDDDELEERLLKEINNKNMVNSGLSQINDIILDKIKKNKA